VIAMSETTILSIKRKRPDLPGKSESIQKAPGSQAIQIDLHDFFVPAFIARMQKDGLLLAKNK
jgi:hypothetical protein